jgi:riboflavin biosynthesis pyrimidine reductase
VPRVLEPLTTLLDRTHGDELPLPPDLARLYGPLRFVPAPGRPHVIANFVTTLDGVTSWNVPGRAGGGEISGFSAEDTAVMGLLRAVSDAVLIGSATLRVVPDHLWTPEFFRPELAPAFQALRSGLGKISPPLAVIVSASGELDVGLRVFASGEEPALIVTTPNGARRLRERGLPPSIGVAALEPSDDGRLHAALIVDAVSSHLARESPRLLVEGGPQLMASFFEGNVLDELFLTLSPQVAGRDPALGSAGWRPGLVEGALLAPDRPAWGRLASVKQRDNHLFLRYQLNAED